MVINQPTSSHPQGLNRKQTLWLILAGMVAILISLFAGLALANSNNYAHWPCHYDPNTINPITYTYFDVQPKGRLAFEQARVVWDYDTTAPGHFTNVHNANPPHNSSLNLAIFDRAFNDSENHFAAWTGYFGCQSGIYLDNITTISFNTNFYNTPWDTPFFWRVIAMHEIGHSYGLAHVYSGCALMKVPIVFPICTSNFPTPSDIAGVHALYPYAR